MLRSSSCVGDTPPCPRRATKHSPESDESVQPGPCPRCSLRLDTRSRAAHRSPPSACDATGSLPDGDLGLWAPRVPGGGVEAESAALRGPDLVVLDVTKRPPDGEPAGICLIV